MTEESAQDWGNNSTDEHIVLKAATEEPNLRMESDNLPARINEEILCCKVCFLEYTTNNMPKMLTCSHTFCHNCIKDFIGSNKAKNKLKFPCPLCRKETQVQGGVKNLPNNYTVLALMDMVERPPENEDGVTDQCTRPSHHDPSPAQQAESSTNISGQTETTCCCRCGKGKGVIPIKCEHKICKDCKKREKKMEVSSIPCQICSNAQNGIDYYTEDNPPPFCEHTRDMRPPGTNPNYSSVTNEFTFDSEYTYGYPKDHDIQHVRYVDDSSHTHAHLGYHADTGQDIQTCGVECPYNNQSYVEDSQLGQIGYQHNGAQLVYSQNSGQNSGYAQDGQMPNVYSQDNVHYSQTGTPTSHVAYTQSSSQAVTSNLCQDFVSRVNINRQEGVAEGSGFRQYPQGLYAQAHPDYAQTHTQLSTQVTGAAQSQHQVSPGIYQPTAGQAAQPIQPMPYRQPTITSPTSAVSPVSIPYQETDPNQHTGQETPPRNNSPPPAYSEIDQHPQPSQSTTPPQRRRPKANKTTAKTDQPPKTTTKSSQSRAKAKTQSSQEARESPPTTRPVRGGVAVLPVAVQQQNRLKSTTEEETSNAVLDHNGENPKDHVRTTIPSGAKRNPTKSSPSAVPVVPTRQAPPAPSSSASAASVEIKAGPKAPPRRLAGEPQGLPFKCIKKFGRYSESKMQSSCFQKPTRVSVSNLGQYIIVTDTQEMTVQIFTSDGTYVYKFKVLGVEGACLWAQDKLAVATNRGVEIYTKNGHQEIAMSIGSCINTVPYKYGFIAIRRSSLIFFNPGMQQIKELTKRRMKSSPFKKLSAFEDIRDAAVSMTKDIAVLEGSGDVFLMDDEGIVKCIIQPHNEPCGKIIDPFSITFDRWSNIFVTDVSARKVLRFSPNGKFSRCVLNFTLGETSTNTNQLRAYGLSASAEADHLLTVICGDKCAEVRIYKLY